jgi:hypothetical protein
MTEYDGQPNSEKLFYRSKFVRVGDKIIITKANDVNTTHKALLEEDGLLEEFIKISAEDPSQVDGGFIVFSRQSPKHPKIILEGTLQGEFHSVKVVYKSNARQITIALFKKITPGYHIVNNENPIPQSSNKPI